MAAQPGAPAALPSATCGIFVRSPSLLPLGPSDQARPPQLKVWPLPQGACVPGGDPCLPPPPCSSALHTLCPDCALGSTNYLRLLPSLTAALARLLSWLLPLARGWAVLEVPSSCCQSLCHFLCLRQLILVGGRERGYGRSSRSSRPTQGSSRRSLLLRAQAGG